MLVAAMAIEILALVLKVVQFARGKKSLIDELIHYGQWLMPITAAVHHFS